MALSPGSRKPRTASSAAFSIARIMTGVASTLGSVGSLNRLARGSGRTRRAKLPLAPTGSGRMRSSRSRLHAPGSTGTSTQWLLPSEPRYGPTGVLDLRRSGETMPHELAPFLEVLGASEVDRMVLDRIPFDEHPVPVRLLHRTLQLHPLASAGALEDGRRLLYARLELGLQAGLDVDLRNFQHHGFHSSSKSLHHNAGRRAGSSCAGNREAISPAIPLGM